MCWYCVSAITQEKLGAGKEKNSLPVLSNKSKHMMCNFSLQNQMTRNPYIELGNYMTAFLCAEFHSSHFASNARQHQHGLTFNQAPVAVVNLTQCW